MNIIQFIKIYKTHIHTIQTQQINEPYKGNIMDISRNCLGSLKLYYVHS